MQQLTTEQISLWQTYLRGRNPYSCVVVNGVYDSQTQQETRETRDVFGLSSGEIDDVLIECATKDGFVGFNEYVVKQQQTLSPLIYNDRLKLFGVFSFQATPQKGNPEAIKIDESWVKHNITTINISQLIGKKGCSTGNIAVNRLCVKQFVDFFNLVEKAKLISRIITFDGSWNPRFVRGSSTYLSNHAWGTAFDINAGYNPLGTIPKNIGQQGSVVELLDIATQCGFAWGGNMKRPDGMHFEIAKLKG